MVEAYNLPSKEDTPQSDKIKAGDLTFFKKKPNRLPLEHAKALGTLCVKSKTPRPKELYTIHFVPASVKMAHEVGDYLEEDIPLTPAERAHNKLLYFESLQKLLQQKDEIPDRDALIFSAPTPPMSKFMDSLPEKYNLNLNFGQDNRIKQGQDDYSIFTFNDLLTSLEENQDQLTSACAQAGEELLLVLQAKREANS